MKRRQKASTWEIHPDEQMGIDWRTVRDCLSAVGRKCEVIDYPLLGPFLTDPHYEILEFSEVKSHEHPACQVADLFAGLAAFSKARFDNYDNWCRENDKQSRLPLFTQEKHSFTNREEYRFQTLKYFSDCCKKHKLGVSINTYHCLCTRDPKHPLNFWHYAPQHERDRAPQKPKGTD